MLRTGNKEMNCMFSGCKAKVKPLSSGSIYTLVTEIQTAPAERCSLCVPQNAILLCAGLKGQRKGPVSITDTVLPAGRVF